MSDDAKSPTRAKAETIWFWGRFAGWGFVLLTALWVQFLGQGVRTWAQDFTGLTDFREEVKQGQLEMSARLSFIENNITPTKVVDWVVEASGQIGECHSLGICDYKLVGGRTPYGESCGMPTEIKIYIRHPDGRLIITKFKDGWKPPILNRYQTDFYIPLVMPLLASGEYLWRNAVTYEHCPGPNEPKERLSPWFPLTIS